MFTNDFNQDTRGIITYVSKEINCKQIQFHKDFKEYVLLELRIDTLVNLRMALSTEVLTAQPKMMKNY